MMHDSIGMRQGHNASLQHSLGPFPFSPMSSKRKKEARAWVPKQERKLSNLADTGAIGQMIHLDTNTVSCDKEAKPAR